MTDTASDTTRSSPAERPPRPGSPVTKILLASGSARLVVLPITGIASLVLARYVTAAVGIATFGAVMLVATLSQLLTFADLGANAAVANASAQLGSDPEGSSRLRRVFLSALRVVLVATTILVAVAVVVGLTGQWPAILGVEDVPGGWPMSANLAIVLALVTFSLSLPLSLGEPLLRGSGHMHQAVLLTGLATPLALLIAVLLHAAGVTSFAYALAIPLGALIACALTAVAASRRTRSMLHGVLLQALQPKRFPGLPILATAAPWFVVMLGLPVALQTDRIIIAHRAPGLTDLADYSYATQLYGPLWSVISIAALGLWPVFAGRKGGGKVLRSTWFKAVGLLSVCGIGFALAFLLLATVLIAWISRGESHPTLSLLLSFALLLTVQSLHVGTGIMLISPVQLRFQAGCVIALVATNIPLSWVLAPVLGPTGPVLASAITVAACQLIPGVIAGFHWTVADHEAVDDHPVGAAGGDDVTSDSTGTTAPGSDPERH